METQPRESLDVPEADFRGLAAPAGIVPPNSRLRADSTRSPARSRLTALLASTPRHLLLGIVAGIAVGLIHGNRAVSINETCLGRVSITHS